MAKQPDQEEDPVSIHMIKMMKVIKLWRICLAAACTQRKMSRSLKTHNARGVIFLDR